MSRAGGEIWTPAGEFFGAFMYDGTSDVAYPRVFPALDLAWEAYLRGDDLWPNSAHSETCPGLQEVVLFTDYGHGFWWRGTACSEHQSLGSGCRDTFELETHDGHPFPKPAL